MRRETPTSARLHDLNAEISREFARYRKEKWYDAMLSCNTYTGPGRYWRIVNSLKGGFASAKSAVDFGKGPVVEPKLIAAGFNAMFLHAVPHQVSKVRKKRCRKVILRKQLGDAPVFSAIEVFKAIKAMKSKRSAGPDGLSMLQLKHLGPKAIGHLCAIFNASVSRCWIPAIWKTAHIVPLPKPGKDASLAASYRPVSLLCPAAKVLERLLLPSLREHLPLPAFQHGFRPRHSTTTALMKIVASAQDGFNKKLPSPSRTLVVALDLTKAFDSLDHATLIQKLAVSSLPNAIVRWLASYLHGRQIRTMFRDTISSARNLRVGSPQGSVISPHLFAFYCGDIPEPPAPLSLAVYADDITVFGTGDRLVVQRALNAYLPQLRDHLSSLFLRLSPAKSSVTMLTPVLATPINWSRS